MRITNGLWRYRLMLYQNGEIDALMKLGLTSRQAKILLVLSRAGVSTASSLTDSLKISRQDVYKVLTELKQAGLIEKHLTTPAKYEALQLNDIFQILIDRRKQETSNLKTLTEKIIEDFDTDPIVKKQNETDSQMVLIPKNEALLMRLLKAVANAQQSIDIISSGKPSQRGFLLGDEFEKAVNRGVKLRFMSNKYEQANLQLEIRHKMKKNPFFEKRLMRNRPVARIRIFDKKEVFVTLFPYKEFTRSPALWSNNPNFIELFTDYFETVWRSAEKTD